jgi:peptidoglycan biosynthesis protein MviN/MurJ (putative lipid II flippase)
MTAGQGPANDVGHVDPQEELPMINATVIFWAMLFIMLASLLYGLLGVFSAYDHVGHSPLALDVSFADDLDQMVREAR